MLLGECELTATLTLFIKCLSTVFKIFAEVKLGMDCTGQYQFVTCI